MLDMLEDPSVYPVSDDSKLLLKAVVASKGKVLDMCAGSGIIGLNAAKFADEVTLVDINDHALNLIKLNASKNNIKNIKVIKSDLFKEIGEKRFDVIFMNPPYLPGDPSTSDSLDIATLGGKEGSELTERFGLEAPSHLEPSGRIFIVLSTKSNLDRIYGAIRRAGLSYTVIDSDSFFFEKLILIELH